MGQGHGKVTKSPAWIVKISRHAVGHEGPENRGTQLSRELLYNAKNGESGISLNLVTMGSEIYLRRGRRGMSRNMERGDGRSHFRELD